MSAHSTTYFKLSYPIHPQEEPHLTDPVRTFGKASNHKGLVGLHKAREVNRIECLGKGNRFQLQLEAGREGEKTSNSLFSMFLFSSSILLSLSVFNTTPFVDPKALSHSSLPISSSGPTQKAEREQVRSSFREGPKLSHDSHRQGELFPRSKMTILQWDVPSTKILTKCVLKKTVCVKGI